MKTNYVIFYRVQVFLIFFTYFWISSSKNQPNKWWSDIHFLCIPARVLENLWDQTLKRSLHLQLVPFLIWMSLCDRMLLLFCDWNNLWHNFPHVYRFPITLLLLKLVSHTPLTVVFLSSDEVAVPQFFFRSFFYSQCSEFVFWISKFLINKTLLTTVATSKVRLAYE